MSSSVTTVRDAGEGEQRWFAGGGHHTWKATAEETNGAFMCFEDHMAAGKVTPLHRHPESDEAFYVLEGEVVVQIEGEERTLGPGGFSMALRGVPHALMTTTETRLLVWQTPPRTEGFFRYASEPVSEDTIDGPVDFGLVKESADENGGVEILGPPPFA